jgi:enamine deaminase RidA (YjgF/YER057c/UK114 family)
MPKERIQPEGLAKPPTYSHVVKAGDTIYLAGQTPVNERGEVVHKGNVTGQATQVFENMKKALGSVGADFSDLVKVTVYVTDPRFRDAVGEVRRQYMADALPASTLVVAAGLANPDYLLEIEGIAVLG